MDSPEKKLLLSLFETAIEAVDELLDTKYPAVSQPENDELPGMEQFEDPITKLMAMAEKALNVNQVRPRMQYDLFDMREDLLRAYSFVKFNL